MIYLDTDFHACQLRSAGNICQQIPSHATNLMRYDLVTTKSRTAIGSVALTCPITILFYRMFDNARAEGGRSMDNASREDGINLTGFKLEAGGS